MELYQWQKDYINDFFNRPDGEGSCLYASTGLGKSVLMMELLKRMMKEGKTVLIITPSHLIPDWNKRSPIKPTECSTDPKAKTFTLTDKVNIISIQKVSLYKCDFDSKIDLLIVDEAHRAKNWTSNVYKHIISLLPNVNKVMTGSATYVTKNKTDLITNAFFVSKKLRDKVKWSFWKYADKNVIFQNQYFGNKSFRTPVDIVEDSLKNDILPCYYLMNYKKAGLPEPILHQKDVYYDLETNHTKILNDENLMFDALTQMLEDGKAISQDKVLELFLKFQFQNSDFTSVLNNISYKLGKTFSYKAKFQALKSIIDGHEGKGLIFYFYKAERDALLENLGSSVFEYVDYKSIEEFEKNDKKVMILNLSAVGEGVRIIYPEFIVEFTLSFDFGRTLQARGRLQHAGRTEPYTVYTLVPNHPKVSRLMNNIQKKIRDIAEIQGMLTN